MSSQPLTPSQKRYRRRAAIMSLVSAALVIAFFFAMDPFEPDGPRRIDDTLAVVAAFLVLHMGLLMTFVHTATPKDAPMPRQRLAQVLACVISGVTLLLPFFGERFIDPTLNFAIILVLTVASLVTTWFIWRGADELARALMKDAYMANYIVLVTALVVYAAGERLGLLRGVTAWGALAFATLVSIPCSYWVAYRHGLNRPPSDE